MAFLLEQMLVRIGTLQGIVPEGGWNKVIQSIKKNKIKRETSELLEAVQLAPGRLRITDAQGNQCLKPKQFG